MTHPVGRVDGPVLLYGGVGLALAVAMQVLGLFKKGDARLENALLEPVFHGVTPGVLSMPVLVMIAAVFCFGIAFAVLDSVGAWRRVVLGVTALVIILAMVPTFAVWKIYFSPFLPAVALFWTWFCTMMYVNHHVMPCEVSSFKFQTPNTKVRAASQPVEEKVEVKQDEEEQDVDPDAKYKPKVTKKPKAAQRTKHKKRNGKNK
ncbi:MAG: YIP1 family protein [Akkermansiaceae bacterium]|nr:YIP1 family protein [Akkermansiaceae bacterium]